MCVIERGCRKERVDTIPADGSALPHTLVAKPGYNGTYPANFVPPEPGYTPYSIAEELNREEMKWLRAAGK